MKCPCLNCLIRNTCRRQVPAHTSFNANVALFVFAIEARDVRVFFNASLVFHLKHHFAANNRKQMNGTIKLSFTFHQSSRSRCSTHIFAPVVHIWMGWLTAWSSVAQLSPFKPAFQQHNVEQCSKIMCEITTNNRQKSDRSCFD